MRPYPTGDLLPEQVVGKHYYTNGNGGVKIHFVRKEHGTPVREFFEDYTIKIFTWNRPFCFFRGSK